MIDEKKENLMKIYGKYMILNIFIDSDDVELKKKYIDSVNERNKKVIDDIRNIDAGFDLFAPEASRFTSSGVNKLDYKIMCSAKIFENSAKINIYNTGFYMYPRSSISKSNIRLANNVGIVDAGYRGHLIGMFDVAYKNEVDINKFDRHLQICAPGLIPIIVKIVDSLQELGEETSRGDGGFGSTGI
jgi:dUTP pyrophosphatase